MTWWLRRYDAAANLGITKNASYCTERTLPSEALSLIDAFLVWSLLVCDQMFFGDSNLFWLEKFVLKKKTRFL